MRFLQAFLLALSILLTAVSCTKLGPTVNVLEGLCTLNLTEHPVVVQVAEERKIPVAELAAILCSIPAIYDAWEASRDARSGDPAGAAIREAERIGAL